MSTIWTRRFGRVNLEKLVVRTASIKRRRKSKTAIRCAPGCRPGLDKQPFPAVEFMCSPGLRPGLDKQPNYARISPRVD
jgi:hypothetical protein